MLRYVGLAAVLAALVVIGRAAAEPPDKELKALEGTWTITEGYKEGEDAGKEIVGVKLVIEGDKLTLKGIKGRDETVRFKIDPKTKPMSIDIMPGMETVPGIYSIEGDVLKLCFVKMGGERPKDFKPTKENRYTLLVAKRDK